MTILEGLTEAHNKVKTSTAGDTIPLISDLQFAQLQEFSAFKDGFVFETYPVNVVVPVPLDGVLTNARAQELITVQGWFLLRISEDTNNYRSKLIEDVYINPMRRMARKFILNLVDSDMIDSEAGDIAYSIAPEYTFLSAHLFGVSYTVRLPILSNVCR